MKLDTQTAVVSFRGRNDQIARYRVTVTPLGEDPNIPEYAERDVDGAVAQFMRGYDFAELFQIREYDANDDAEWKCVPWL